MLLRQIQHFQAVVQLHSFTEAAEACHISQSGISQSIMALESQIGATLLRRRNRGFDLTEAGEHFYKKSLALTADLEQLCRETVQIERGEAAGLTLGCLSTYVGDEFKRAVAAFSQRYPAVKLKIVADNHEALRDGLRFGRLDLILNDQRRPLFGEYERLVLMEAPCCVEIATRNPLSNLETVSTDDLKNTPCILVANRDQQEEVRRFYRDSVGLKGDFVFADTLQSARVLVATNRGVLPLEGAVASTWSGATLRRIPLRRNGEPVVRTYCAFWKKGSSAHDVEAFAELLKEMF